MSKRNICKEDLEGFYPKTRLFGQHRKVVNKAIDVVTDPIRKKVWFIYSENHVNIYSGPDLDEAIELFNK